MQKLILAAALALVPALFFTGKATAQTKAQYGTEVCVNASLADEAKLRFPTATIHVVPDFPDPAMNGWRVVAAPVGAKGRIHTDAEEIALRHRERLLDSSIRGE